MIEYNNKGFIVTQALEFDPSYTKQEDYVVQNFVNELFGSVRSVLINNEPWFIGKDIARCLGYVDTDQAIRKHVYDEDRYFLRPVDLTGLNLDIDLGGKNNYGITIINESGLYSLILRSNLPSVRQFQYWVTHEVLPTMRNIGFTNSMSILRQLEELQMAYNKNEEYRQQIQNNFMMLGDKLQLVCDILNAYDYNLNELLNSPKTEKEVDYYIQRIKEQTASLQREYESNKKYLERNQYA